MLTWLPSMLITIIPLLIRKHNWEHMEAFINIQLAIHSALQILPQKMRSGQKSEENTRKTDLYSDHRYQGKSKGGSLVSGEK